MAHSSQQYILSPVHSSLFKFADDTLRGGLKPFSSVHFNVSSFEGWSGLLNIVPLCLRLLCLHNSSVTGCHKARCPVQTDNSGAPEAPVLEEKKRFFIFFPELVLLFFFFYEQAGQRLTDVRCHRNSESL